MKSKEIMAKITAKRTEARGLIEKDNLKEARKKTEEVRSLEDELERAIEEEAKEIEELRNNGMKLKSNGKLVDETRTVADKNIILPSERFEVRNKPAETVNISLAKLVKGMSGKGWDGAEEERSYLGGMLSMNNQAVIPVEMSNQIIDRARANSSILGRIKAYPMGSNNVTIAVVNEDAEANFVIEGQAIPKSKPVLGKVTMEGKTLAMFVPVSEQLLDSAPNIEVTLQEITAKAIATALDKAILYGKGVIVGSDGEKTQDEIKGISLYDTINVVQHNEAKSYDMLLKGVRSCRNSNTVPSDITYSTNTAADLASIKDTTGRYIEPPRTLDQYTVSESNNVKDNEAYVYDFNSMLIGVHKGITIEWGTSEDLFGRLMKGLRVYLRADLALTNAKGITKIVTAE